MAENSASLSKSHSLKLSNLRRVSLWFGDLAKRTFDILVSTVGLILLSPVLALIAVLVKRDSSGPVFYSGLRLGRGGQLFHILKFRTMYETPSSYEGPRVTTRDDPRVTRLGRWLRDTKLNELPQFWNVLKGEMSLVGPRPEDPAISHTLSRDILAEVLSVRPGITSPASVVYRNEEALLTISQVMDTYLESILPSKLRLDQLYVRHRSFWLDLDILFWTFLVLVPRLGSYEPAEESLFAGPISSFIRRYVSWFTIDTLTSLAAMGVTGVYWRSLKVLDVGWPVAILFTLGFAFMFSLAGSMLGVNRISWSRAGAEDVFDLIPAAGIATLAALFVNQFWPAQLFWRIGMVWIDPPLFPPAMILMASALAFAGFVAVRYRSRLISGLAASWLKVRGDARAAQERVLIVGSGEAGQFAAWLLSSGRNLHVYQIIGYVDDDLYKQGLRIHGTRVLGRRADIPHLVKEQDVGILVFAIHNIDPVERQRMLDICTATHTRIVLMPDVYAMLNQNSSVPADYHPVQTTSSSSGGLSPCEVCQDRFSPLQLDAWLAQLESAFQAGDQEAIQAQIQSLRNLLRAETEWKETLQKYEK